VVTPFNVITVSREYGAGGGEVARLLAEALGWQLLDRELLHQAAAIEHVPDADLERLDEKALSLIDRLSWHPPHQKYIHGLTEAVHQAATRGKVVLVGRGTRQLVGDLPGAFHLRLVAPRAWRVNRMCEREQLSEEQAGARLEAVDRTRDRFTRYFFGPDTLKPENYDLVVNTGRVPLPDIVGTIADLVGGRSVANDVTRPRVLTLSRQLGADEAGFPRQLAKALALECFDRELLEQDAARLGVSTPELEKVDEHRSGIFQMRPGSLSLRYFDALGGVMNELATRGNVLLVGRGANHFLNEHPWAFHVRLVAASDARVKHVMERHWVREEPARQLITESDTERQRFFQERFQADWANPLEYHVTVNSGRLEGEALRLIADAAQRHWKGVRA
jgi:cytidylate kinase